MKPTNQQQPAPPPEGSKLNVPSGNETGNNNNNNKKKAVPTIHPKKKTRHPTWSCRTVTLLVVFFVVAAGILAAGCWLRTDLHSDDDDKYSEYFPFDWTFDEKGIFMGEALSWRTMTVLDLETCMSYCEDSLAIGGNYYNEFGMVPGYNTANCFCMDSLLCVVEFTEYERQTYAPAGTSFSRTRRDDHPTCDGNYCDSSVANCE